MQSNGTAVEGDKRITSAGNVSVSFGAFYLMKFVFSLFIGIIFNELQTFFNRLNIFGGKVHFGSF